MSCEWEQRALKLAEQVTHPTSRWRSAIAAVPRHLLVPHWFARSGGDWKATDGPADPERWLEQAYRDATLVTRIGPLHADAAAPGELASGRPTSSATLPTLVLWMLRHLRAYEGARILDVGTGPGYAAALLAHRFGDDSVTSVDVDAYLVDAARERLGEAGLRPCLQVCDATGPLPGRYDRIVATVSVRPVPPSWLAALNSGGVLVTTLSGTSLIVSATKQADGSAKGRVVSDEAGFMSTRQGEDYPSEPEPAFCDDDGEEVYRGRFPVPNLDGSWGLATMLELAVPGLKHRYEELGEQRMTWMAHADGSWARACAFGSEAPTVHEGGPRRLWRAYEAICCDWVTRGGSLPLTHANVHITPDGVVHLSSWGWAATA